MTDHLAFSPIATPPAIRLDAVALRRGERWLARGLSGQLAAGRAFHLLAPNGVGKTTLLETLAGLREPAAGRVSGLAAGGFHWLGHRNALAADLSAFASLRAEARAQGERVADERLEAAFAATGLKAPHRPVRTLSTGQRRRAALARLLVIERPWWLLDEPLPGLDAAGVGLVAELVRRHVARGGGVVFSSHQALVAPGTGAGWLVGWPFPGPLPPSVEGDAVLAPGASAIRHQAPGESF